MVNGKIASRQYQERVNLYMYLASLDSLDGLSSKVQRELFSRVQRTRYTWLDFVRQLASGVQEPQLSLPWPRNLVDYEAIDWKRLLQEAREGKPADRETQAAKVFLTQNRERLENLKRRWVFKGVRPPMTLFEEGMQAKKGWTPEAYTAVCLEALRRAHRWAHFLIPALTNGGMAGGNPPKIEHYRFDWAVVNGKLEEFPIGVQPEDEILFDLLKTLKSGSFPFCACPVCRGILFEREKESIVPLSVQLTLRKPPRGQYIRKRTKAWRENQAKKRRAKAA
jgi:hypothetical protein